MIKIKDIMNKNIISVQPGETLQHAAKLAHQHLISDMMVIDENNNFIGVLSEGDLIRAVVPDMNELIKHSGQNIKDAAKVFLDSGANLALQPIDRMILHNAVTLHPTDDLLKAAIVMVSKQIRRLPVVEGKKLVGTVSRAEICFALFNP